MKYTKEFREKIESEIRSNEKERKTGEKLNFTYLFSDEEVRAILDELDKLAQLVYFYHWQSGNYFIPVVGEREME